MLGTILFVDEATGTGIIRADDGKRYRFPTAEWLAAAPLAAGIRVDFDTDGDSALAPIPVSDALVNAVTSAAPPDPVIAPAADPGLAPAPLPLPSEPMSTDQEQVAPAPTESPSPLPDHTADEAPTFAADPIAAQPAEPVAAARPVPIETDELPDYVGLGETQTTSGGTSTIFVIGGAILLLALAALAYMMWDNAESAGFAAGASEESGESVSFYAQEDLPVRNVAAMTNATVLGRIARGDRVSGVEVDGSADPTSRWLRLDGGNRFVPMTGLGPSAPPAVAAAPVPPIVPVPNAPPASPDGPDYENSYGGQGGDYRADRNGPIDAVPPVPNRIDPPVRPVRPTPPPARPTPVRPSRPPERQVQPSRPEDTRPVGPQRPTGPQRGGDPRETQPVG